jgi:co-chaperonin GroES (HSP10)
MEPGKIKATGQWVVLKVDPPEKVSKGGIILVDDSVMATIGHATGVVIRKGGGRRNWGKGCENTFTPVDVELGERVVFRGHKQNAHRPSFLDKEHCIIHEDDIYGVLEEGQLELAMPYDNL